MTDLRGLVEAHLTAELARGLAPGTIVYRRVYLGQLLDWLDRRGIDKAAQLTPAVLDDYLIYLQARKINGRPRSVATHAAEVSVLRSFARWLAANHLVLVDLAAGLRLGNRRRPLPKQVLSEAEVAALLAAPGQDTLGLRDRAILETLYSTGIRRAELCALDLYDLDTVQEVVRVRQGKGGRERIVPVGRPALDAIRQYVRHARPELVASPKETALFVAAITRRRLSVKTLNYLVRKHAKVSGIAKPVTPHSLRHSCATHLLRGGADIRHVQAILGHASITTTQIYTRVAVEDLIQAHRRHHPRTKLRVP